MEFLQLFLVVNLFAFSRHLKLLRWVWYSYVGRLSSNPILGIYVDASSKRTITGNSFYEPIPGILANGYRCTVHGIRPL